MERSGEAQQLREDRELEILLISYLSATIGRRGHKSHELRRPKAQPHPNPNQVQMGLKVRSYHYTPYRQKPYPGPIWALNFMRIPYGFICVQWQTATREAHAATPTGPASGRGSGGGARRRCFVSQGEFKYYMEGNTYDYARLDKAVHQSHTQGQRAFSLRQHQRRPRDRATRDMEHDGSMHGPVLRVLRLLS